MHTLELSMLHCSLDFSLKFVSLNYLLTCVVACIQQDTGQCCDLSSVSLKNILVLEMLG